MAPKGCLVTCLLFLCCFNIDASRTLDAGSKPQGDPGETDHCYAIVRTNDPSSTYLGASGSVSIYNPATLSFQWTAARMRLGNGDDSIEAGWMVNEGLFKDNKTHLYIRFMAGESGCYNLECPGFVHVGKDVAIGQVPDKVSERGGQQYGWRLSIDKNKDDGNWWLSIGDDKYGIGYWPKSLFRTLAAKANQVEWGGEVYYPKSTETPPEMGSGDEPTYDTKSSAFYSLTKLIDGSYHEIDPPTNTVKYQNCNLRYRVIDSGYTGPIWGRIILFGGPVIH